MMINEILNYTMDIYLNFYPVYKKSVSFMYREVK